MAWEEDRCLHKKRDKGVFKERPVDHVCQPDEFYMKLSKPIIDKIDKVSAKHYGFTEEELDFIINYDIKYRMGDELNDSE